MEKWRFYVILKITRLLISAYLSNCYNSNCTAVCYAIDYTVIYDYYLLNIIIRQKT